MRVGGGRGSGGGRHPDPPLLRGVPGPCSSGSGHWAEQSPQGCPRPTLGAETARPREGRLTRARAARARPGL